LVFCPPLTWELTFTFILILCSAIEYKDNIEKVKKIYPKFVEKHVVIPHNTSILNILKIDIDFWGKITRVVGSQRGMKINPPSP